MIRTIQGDYAPDESLSLQRPWTQGVSGIIATRSKLTDTVIIEPEPQPVMKMDDNTVPYVPPPIPTPTPTPVPTPIPTPVPTPIPTPVPTPIPTPVPTPTLP
jgi:hypothetical protein